MKHEVLPLNEIHGSINKVDNAKACFADQYLLEQLVSKNNLMPRLCEEFLSSDHIIKIIDTFQIDRKFAANLLAILHIRKQTSPEVLVGCLLPYAKYDQNLCAKWIEDCVKADLANYRQATDKVIFIYQVCEVVQDELNCYQYELPMITPPCEVTRNTETGYLNRNSFIVANRSADNQDYNLDCINIINAVPLHINKKIALGIENTWKNCCHKEGESEEDYKKKLKALNRYNKHARSIIQHYVNSDYTCYLVHKYDKRGRVYARGYYINTQGNPWCKAGLNMPAEQLKEA